MDSETLEALEEITQEIPRLVLYADELLHHYYWLGQRGGPPLGGKDPADIVQQAICDVLDGIRMWNKKKPFLKFLMEDVIKSQVWNLSQLIENQRTVRLRSLDQDDYSDGFYPLVNHNNLPNSDKNVHKRIDIDLRWKEEAEKILTYLDDDCLVCSIAEIIIYDDINKPQKLSKLLNIEISEIYNGMKRLRRRMKKWIGDQGMVLGEEKNG